MGCRAVIIIREIMRFPAYKVNSLIWLLFAGEYCRWLCCKKTFYVGYATTIPCLQIDISRILIAGCMAMKTYYFTIDDIIAYLSDSIACSVCVQANSKVFINTQEFFSPGTQRAGVCAPPPPLPPTFYRIVRSGVMQSVM